jgi:hypothetical protein
MITVTIDELFALCARQAEVVKRVKTGSLTIEAALAGTQGILDKIYPGHNTQNPTWYVSPEEQIARNAVLFLQHPQWGFSVDDIPPIPAGFVPQTKTEVLMLAIYLPKKGKIAGVQRTFDELYGCLEAPVGFEKWRWPDLKSDAEHLRLLDGRKHRPGIRWVAFDPFANWNPRSGRKVEDLWATCGKSLAASEGFDALRLFPALREMDGKNFPHFDLAGYQVTWDGARKAWADCPYVCRLVDDRQMKLSASWADGVYRIFSAPTVRELL